MTFEGRRLLYRVGLWCSREWGLALARTSPMIGNQSIVDWNTPFEVYAWHDALEIVDDLRSGRPVKEKFRGKS